MYCRVLQLWENGHLLPNHRLNAGSEWREGAFTLEPIQHEEFHRTLHRATLIQPIEAGGQGAEVLPYLYDASVVAMQRDWLRVSGFYFDSCTKNALMQTWHVVILANNYREWVIMEGKEKQLRK